MTSTAITRPRRAPLLAALLASSLLLATLAGCGPAFRQPVVTLENVTVAGIGLSGGTLMVHLEVENPNRFALTANQLRYALSIADPSRAGDTVWIDVAEGVHARPFTVGARETGYVQIPVEFTYAGMGSAVASLLRRGTFEYRARGVVEARTPVGTRDIPFSRQGLITLSGAR
jgi:LEA14-like dessication related protein